MIVETYLDEEAVRRVQPGASGIFMSESLAGPVLSVRVAQIDADATRVLPSGLLSAQAGGHVLTRQNKGELIPELGVYRVLLEVETPIGELAGQTWRGRLSIRGAPESLAGRYARQALAIVTRESGF
jgi:putative peptide zinc metalloprotease protein